ncbi:hypothetical protein MLD38_032432 [Melastoma candidum]|uniref:Uncharacterized protein n=1 Tax=Melastoma candidum TaxID=119954 RepID=A0ACB9M3J7_9MYRT|nr:hypothetical protein MLD38_032432 [Melastoma candidum]
MLMEGELPSERSSHRRSRSEFQLPANERRLVYEFMSPRVSGSSPAVTVALDISAITARDDKGWNNLRHQ